MADVEIRDETWLLDPTTCKIFPEVTGVAFRSYELVLPLEILEGATAIVFAVRSPEDREERTLVLRITKSAEGFSIQQEITPLTNAIVTKRASPFFITIFQTFQCDRFPELTGTNWREVRDRVSKLPKFVIPTSRIFCTVSERGALGELFDLAGDPQMTPTLNFVNEQIDRMKLNFVFQLIHGMAAMHRNKITHRDVKPENLVLGEKALGDEDRVFVIGEAQYQLQNNASRRIRQFSKTKEFVALNYIDFDFAHVQENSGKKQTLQSKGTTDFMAPEVVAFGVGGVPDDTFLFPTDVYSLGTTLADMILINTFGNIRFPRNPTNLNSAKWILWSKALLSGLPSDDTVKKYTQLNLSVINNTQTRDFGKMVLGALDDLSKWRDDIGKAVEDIKEMVDELAGIFSAENENLDPDEREEFDKIDFYKDLGLGADGKIVNRPRFSAILRDGLIAAKMLERGVNATVREMIKDMITWDFSKRVTAEKLLERREFIDLLVSQKVLQAVKQPVKTPWDFSRTVVTAENIQRQLSSNSRLCTGTTCKHDAKFKFQHELFGGEDYFIEPMFCSHVCASRYWNSMHLKK